MRRDIERLANEQFDVIVIGAGIHGACVARDAALRGLKVALIDKADFGSATSHNSLKTIHGGVRYLQHLNFKRTYQSLHELVSWLRVAPHLTKPLPMLMPTYGWGMRGPIAMAIGLLIYELLGWRKNKRLAKSSRLRRAKILSPSACLEMFPDLEHEGLTGGALWQDGQIEYADRAIWQLTEDAWKNDAVVANYIRADSLIVEHGSVLGVSVFDEVLLSRFKIKGSIVVNATGPWVHEFLEGAGCPTDRTYPVNKALNLVTSRPSNDAALAIQSTYESDSKFGKSKRLYFFVPWQGKLMVGTKYLKFETNADGMRYSEQEIASFIDEVNQACPQLKLERSEVLYCHQGLGPAAELSDGTTADTQKLLHHSRVVAHKKAGFAGLFSIISVKWTTARLVAEQAVDLLISSGTFKSRSFGKCLTRERPIGSVFWQEGKVFSGLDAKAIELKTIELIDETMACQLSDVLLRRTDELMLGRMPYPTINMIAKTMANFFDWDESERKQQIQRLKSIPLPKTIERELTEQLFQ